MSAEPRIYGFDEFTLDPAERQLRKAGTEVPLRPKAFETLLALVERAGRAVRKAELFDAVWPDTSVSDAVLTHCIAEVRQALDDDVRSPRFVKTLARLGYKFIGSVSLSPAESGPHPAGASAGGVTAAQRVDALVLPAAGAPSPSAIAVLPFANLSPDSENDYFCDGLSEELINGLTRVRGLRVVAHSSSFSFKGHDLDARSIGRTLNVGSILEGSVRKTGDRLRISAQLIDAANGYHRWCEQYDRRLEDVFAVQDEISRAILSSLEVEFGGKTGGAPATRPAHDMEAYLLYLQGRAYWHRRYAGLLQQAMQCFERAIQKDPGFALAYVGLADCCITLGIWAYAPPRDAFPRAGLLVRKALDLDVMLAEAHASQGMISCFYDREWDVAGRSFARALDLNPGSALTRLWNGHYLSIIGRMDDSIAEMREAQALDPLSPVVSANLGWTYHLAHRQDMAIAELLSVLRAVPGNATALFYLGHAYAEVGRCGEALRCFQTAADVTGGMPWLAESIGLVHGLAGRKDLARTILHESEAKMAGGYVPSSAIAMLHLGLEDDDATFEWLDRSVEERDALLPWVKFMPRFDRLHGDPRFQALLDRIGLP